MTIDQGQSPVPSQRLATGDHRTALRRFGLGGSMILAPLVWLFSSVLGPSHQESRTLAGPLNRIAADPNRFLAFILLGLLSHALLIPAVLGIAHLIKGRRLLGTRLVPRGEAEDPDDHQLGWVTLSVGAVAALVLASLRGHAPWPLARGRLPDGSSVIEGVQLVQTTLTPIPASSRWSNATICPPWPSSGRPSCSTSPVWKSPPESSSSSDWPGSASSL